MKNMKVKSLWLSRPAAACLLVGLLCCLPTVLSTHKSSWDPPPQQAFKGKRQQSQAFAADSSVAVAETVRLPFPGRARAAALETSLAGGLSQVSLTPP